MRPVIVLAMHGVPPRDFPPRDAAELLQLHARLEHEAGPERAALAQRYAALDARVRTWPRTAVNDPFEAAAHALARELERVIGMVVITGFNEFCAPSLDQALDQAAGRAPEVVVVTTMMTRGGAHAESEIPAAIARARERHPGTRFTYAWPFPTPEIARFVAGQIAKAVPARS